MFFLWEKHLNYKISILAEILLYTMAFFREQNKNYVVLYLVETLLNTVKPKYSDHLSIKENYFIRI